MLLNRVIRQVYHSIGDISEIILAARSAYVPLLVIVCLEVAINVGSKAVRTDVKLTALVEQRVVNVFLDDVSSSREKIASFYDLFNFLEIFRDFDAASSV